MTRWVGRSNTLICASPSAQATRDESGLNAMAETKRQSFKIVCLKLFTSHENTVPSLAAAAIFIPSGLKATASSPVECNAEGQEAARVLGRDSTAITIPARQTILTFISCSILIPAFNTVGLEGRRS